MSDVCNMEKPKSNFKNKNSSYFTSLRSKNIEFIPENINRIIDKTIFFDWKYKFMSDIKYLQGVLVIK